MPYSEVSHEIGSLKKIQVETFRLVVDIHLIDILSQLKIIQLSLWINRPITVVAIILSPPPFGVNKRSLNYGVQHDKIAGLRLLLSSSRKEAATTFTKFYSIIWIHSFEPNHKQQ